MELAKKLSRDGCRIAAYSLVLKKLFLPRKNRDHAKKREMLINIIYQ